MHRVIVGAVGSIVMTAIFATRATHQTTDYYTFAWLFVGIGVFSGIAYAPWMARFTETVEKQGVTSRGAGRPYTAGSSACCCSGLRSVPDLSTLTRRHSRTVSAAVAVVAGRRSPRAAGGSG
ncbi:hypothetical protein OHB00_40380 [Streptomyces sp. NBC_00631]|uniref:hypothetical protein n=1 Tax=Streptomyces sp. NBC_00631 TaxID=2975793 RepID=UPI0030E52EBC